MSLKNKLDKLKKKKNELMHKGSIVTEQKRAEKLRRKKNRIKNMKDGTRKRFTQGVLTRQSPLEFMKTEYQIRKSKRKK